jgi:hypothetical protein
MNKTRDQDFNNPGRCFIVSERQYNYMDLAKAAWPRMMTDEPEKMKDTTFDSFFMLSASLFLIYLDESKKERMQYLFVWQKSWRLTRLIGAHGCW